MKTIPLTQGKYALVDDEDYEWLMQWKWRACKGGNVWYAVRCFKKNGKWITVRMHREIMNAPKGMEIDHINHNGLDNRKQKLRICTHKENQQNRIRPLQVLRHKLKLNSQYDSCPV